jgi:hypothetical protein
MLLANALELVQAAVRMIILNGLFHRGRDDLLPAQGQPAFDDESHANDGGDGQTNIKEYVHEFVWLLEGVCFKNCQPN